MLEQPARPRRVTLLALMVLIFTTLHLIRGWRALTWWDMLAEVLPVSPLYLAATGLVWAATGLLLLWGLWSGARWAPHATLTLALVYTVYYWTDRVWLVNSPVQRASWPFLAALTAVLLAFCIWSLARPKSRAFFAGKH